MEDQNLTSTSNAMTLVSVESSIKHNLAQIAKTRADLKVQKEMVDSFLENDPLYMEHAKAAKDAAAQKSATKQKLLKQSHAVTVVDKIIALREEMRVAQEALSYYLGEYQQMTGFNEFEDENGEVKQIVYVAKLVKKA
ncbi:MAG: hypothetical protein A3D26_02690 [Candidatus Blackburnbacteria bacterium RIFCSPHIGHO2_02_FULL_44_20]|uniref:Uncharacterized protein n=1 Tax=Candidatus Blackburnbacteria bacterium RIFCSPHIGHO2_02_FULL_44_20 TaxID=1797516 RepID=A0A1G1V7N7_9BACT|nr:MAG: hypothetical protein A3E16_03495 [Candidatus Blackburnbacteria bacterium RIFCSPHIGHO2_12_FULL_44_25]OGY11386.1 MAG: hypothetical protein A3D26_02690 [Candidatus Blackburnbacteria bacterium RIFCSPHIGHO2_02_FULL_44_20]